ncbi:MAG TPA: hypothetical protein VLX09_05650 [Stellaceae bacterium]|nr:hypothetical protein [Stellaceae bacterium]
MATAEKFESEQAWPALRLLGRPAGVLLFIYGVLLFAGERLLRDPDTFWHIAAGNWIWSHQGIPATDPFSFSMAGAPWTAHEWLAELILAGAYDALGWTGVVMITALAIAIAFAVLGEALLRVLSPLAALPLIGAAFYLAAGHLTARPHALALPILVLWAAALLKARREQCVPPLTLLPLMTLWANLHAGFVAGLGLAGLFAAEALLMAPSRAERLVQLRRWSLFVTGAALASLLNPHGLALWRFPLELMSNPFALSFVGEWHAPDFSRIQPVEIFLLALLALLARLRLRLPWTRLFLLLGLVHMALGHARNAELLALLTPLLLAEPIAAAWPLGAVVPAPPRSRAIALPLLLLALASGVALARGYPHDESAIAPRRALEAAEQAGLAGPVLNDFDFGGYLIFEGVPPLVDGRIDLFGDAFLRDYAAALAASGDALPRILDRYHITWALLEPSTPAAAALARMPDWQRLYGDDIAVVYRQRRP